jgi:hypothetical protein
VRFDKGGFVLEVLDNSLPPAEPRLLTDLLIDLTNATDADEAVDKAEEPAEDQGLAEVAEIAKKPPLTAANVNLPADTNSAAEQIQDQSTAALPDSVAIKRGRGRPKGSKNKPKTAAQAQTQVQDSMRSIDLETARITRSRSRHITGDTEDDTEQGV